VGANIFVWVSLKDWINLGNNGFVDEEMGELGLRSQKFG